MHERLSPPCRWPNAGAKNRSPSHLTFRTIHHIVRHWSILWIRTNGVRCLLFRFSIPVETSATIHTSTSDSNEKKKTTGEDRGGCGDKSTQSDENYPKAPSHRSFQTYASRNDARRTHHSLPLLVSRQTTNDQSTRQKNSPVTRSIQSCAHTNRGSTTISIRISPPLRPVIVIIHLRESCSFNAASHKVTLA